jgi:hypothetical protein
VIKGEKKAAMFHVKHLRRLFADEIVSSLSGEIFGEYPSLDG